MTALALALAIQQLYVPASEQPPFDIAREYVCRGANDSGEPVHVIVKLEGGKDDTRFTFTPVKGSAWPSKQISTPPQYASFFRSDEVEMWYWTGVSLNLDNRGYGFGFDVKVKGSKPGALRFSREKYAPNLRTGEVKFDPKGAYLDDVPCKPNEKNS